MKEYKLDGVITKIDGSEVTVRPMPTLEVLKPAEVMVTTTEKTVVKGVDSKDLGMTVQDLKVKQRVLMTLDENGKTVKAVVVK